jgi:hypothetical protein
MTKMHCSGSFMNIHTISGRGAWKVAGLLVLRVRRARPRRHKLPCVGHGLITTSCACVRTGRRAAEVHGAARRSDSVTPGCVGRRSDRWGGCSYGKLEIEAGIAPVSKPFVRGFDFGFRFLEYMTSVGRKES